MRCPGLLVCAVLAGCEGPPSAAGDGAVPDASLAPDGAPATDAVPDADIDAAGLDAAVVATLTIIVPEPRGHVQVGDAHCYAGGVGTCVLTLPIGSTVTLAAVDHFCGQFEGWTGDCTGSGATCTLLMDHDRQVSGSFEASGPFELTTSVEGSGRVVSSDGQIDCGADCSQSYGQCEQVTFSGVPEPGSLFAYWSGDCEGNCRCNRILGESLAITAHFEPAHLVAARDFQPIGSGASRPYAYRRTPDGGSVVAGYFQGALLAGDDWVAATNLDGFVLRFDASGEPLWARLVTGAGSELVYDAAVSPDGTIAVVGLSNDGLDLGDGVVLPSQDEGFVALLEADGSVRWAHLIGGWGIVPYRTVVDEAGDVVVAGWLSGPLDIDGQVLSAAVGGGFVVKLDGATGLVEWGTRQQVYGHVGLASRGTDVYVTSGSGNAPDLGCGLLGPVNGPSDAAIARFAADGTCVWSRLAGGEGEERQPVVAVSGTHVAVATGSSSVPGGHMYAFTLDGTPAWDVHVGGIPEAMAATSGGDFVIGGYLGHEITLAGVRMCGEAGGNPWLARFSPIGDARWARRYGSGQGRIAIVDVDPQDHVLAGGDSYAPIDFGAGPIPSTRFLLELAPF